MAHLRRILCLAGLAVGLAASAGAEEVSPLALEGTWHVLVHFKDQSTNHPDVERWEDRVWVLRNEGTRLRWIDYPIVAFDNRSGRFGSVAGNPRARILHYWEPSEVQQAELMKGPKVNSRGSREKYLDASGDGWRSSSSSAGASAMTITFTANWFIDDATGLPRFRMEDVMGSAMTESLEGGTVYETEVVEEGGDVLRGRFTRDDTRVGTFRMLRTPAVRGLGTEEEQRERIRVKLRALFGLDFLEGSTLPENLTEEQRLEVRDEITQAIVNSASAQGQQLRKEQVDGLVDRVEQLLREGYRVQEIEKMFEDGKIVP